MVLIGLLLLALVCLALGLVLTSSAWLIASIIASAGAGILLWRTGSALASGRKDAKPAADAETAESAADASAKTTVLHPVTEDANREVWVIDGRPRYHLADCAIIKGQEAEPIPYSQATEDGFMPCSLCEPNVARTAS